MKPAIDETNGYNELMEINTKKSEKQMEEARRGESKLQQYQQQSIVPHLDSMVENGVSFDMAVYAVQYGAMVSCLVLSCTGSALHAL